MRKRVVIHFEVIVESTSIGPIGTLTSGVEEDAEALRGVLFREVVKTIGGIATCNIIAFESQTRVEDTQ